MPRFNPSALVMLCVIASLLLPTGAGATTGPAADFFVKDASGNATYEAMVIHPSAVYDSITNTTYVVYQGFMFDPHIMAYDHTDKSWQGPVRVGTNPLIQNPHGGPSLALAPDGHLHVFFGAHGGSVRPGEPGSTILHGRSKSPHSILQWDESVVRSGESWTPLYATYPQAVVTDDGVLRLFFRSGGLNRADSSKEDWGFITYLGHDQGWSDVETVLDGIPAREGFYANFSAGKDGRIHAAATYRDWAADERNPYERRGVYYLSRDARGVWRSPAGLTVEATASAESVVHDSPTDDGAGADLDSLRTHPRPWRKSDLDEYCLIPGSDESRSNQVVVRDSGQGAPLVLWLAESSHLEGQYVWTSARLRDGSWSTNRITHTNHFFDSGDIRVSADGTVEAFLTVDRTAPMLLGPAIADARGGDIESWRMPRSSEEWEFVETVRSSAVSHFRYNNPQVVYGGQPDAKLVFSEWGRDASNFRHKVFLYGDEIAGSRYRQRVFQTEARRIHGGNRRATAVAVSLEAFPDGARTAVLAGDHDFADVLCGIPLASSMSAPVLLSGGDALSPEVAAEIERLGAREVVILGGPNAVSQSVQAQIESLRVGGVSGARLVEVRRISGANRYATSVAVAEELHTRVGSTSEAFVASGQSFADSLAVSSLAAALRAPIVLSEHRALPSDVEDWLLASQPMAVTLLGGEAALSTALEDQMRQGGHMVGRIGGENRWETSMLIAAEGLARGISVERPVIASGEGFPDAVSGSVLAARVPGVLLLVPSSLEGIDGIQRSRVFLQRHRSELLEIYIIGGERSVSSEVADYLASSVGAAWH